MHASLPTALEIDAQGECLHTEDRARLPGCPEALSALGFALGALDAIELHAEGGLVLRIEPSAEGTLRVHVPGDPQPC